MKKKILLFISIFFNIVLCVITLILMLSLHNYKSHYRALRSLSEKARIQEYELLLKQLNSEDSSNIESVKNFLKHSIELNSKWGNKNVTIEELYTFYKSKEYPKREKYFGDLLAALSVQQASKPIKKENLEKTLGPPNNIIKINDREVVYLYKFNPYGQPGVAKVFIDGNYVTLIGINGEDTKK